MSTKRLSRTVLEGGRVGYNKYQRRQSHRSERQAERKYCALVRNNCELADELATPKIKPVYKEFTDNLTPVWAWVEKQVGKNWADVRKDLRTKFDDRTLAGYHVVHQHIFAEIDGSGNQQGAWHSSWYIDEGNILQRRSSYESSYYYGRYWLRYRDQKNYLSYHNEPFDPEQQKELIEWLDHRKIQFIDGILYWILPSKAREVQWHKGMYPIIYIETFEVPRYFEGIFYVNLVNIKWREGYRLDRHEINYFRSLPLWVRNAILKAGE